MERAALFGDDLRIVERAGGLDLLADPQGDLALAQGADNIVQALTLRLRVRKGELRAPGLGRLRITAARVDRRAEQHPHTPEGDGVCPRRRGARPARLEVTAVESKVLPGERDVCAF